MAEHATAHVDALTEAIEQRGGTPVPEGSYDLEFESANQMVAVAQTVENASVAAYAGVAPWIDGADVLVAAPLIHSVDARHAAVLNFLAGDSPSPDAFDQALSPAAVFDALGEYFASPPDGIDVGSVGGGNATNDSGGTRRAAAHRAGAERQRSEGTVRRRRRRREQRRKIGRAHV